MVAKCCGMGERSTEIEVCTRMNENYIISHKLPGNGYIQLSLDITPDGTYGVAASHYELSVWDLAPEIPAPSTMGRRGRMGQVLMFGEDQLVAIFHEDGGIRLWNLPTMKLIDEFEAPVLNSKVLGKLRKRNYFGQFRCVASLERSFKRNH